MHWSRQGALRIEAPREQIYGVLTDFEAYSAWCPEVAECRVMAEEGDIAVVEVRRPSPVARLAFEVIESPHEALRFSQVDQVQRRGISGAWGLESGSDGRTLVRLRLSLTTRWPGLGARRRIGEWITWTLDALAQRCLKLEGEGSASQPSRPLLVVRSRGRGLEIRVGGRVYDLIPREERGE